MYKRLSRFILVLFVAYIFITFLFYDPYYELFQNLLTKKRLILIWTPIFGRIEIVDDCLRRVNIYPCLADCPLKDFCEITFDRKKLAKADVVVFHASDISKLEDWPSPTSNKQKFALLSMESPANLEKQRILRKLPRNVIITVKNNFFRKLFSLDVNLFIIIQCYLSLWEQMDPTF